MSDHDEMEYREAAYFRLQHENDDLRAEIDRLGFYLRQNGMGEVVDNHQRFKGADVQPCASGHQALEQRPVGGVMKWMCLACGKGVSTR